MDPDLDALANELCAAHDAHTVILYGSRARGDARLTSDIDLLVLRDAGPASSDHRRWNAHWLDAWIHPTSDVENPEEALLRVCGGRVLCQRDGVGDALLARLSAMREAGPPPLTRERRALCETWLHKTLARVRGAAPDDLDASMRRGALIAEALESYFVLRGRWYPGPKQALEVLAREDDATHACFATALRDPSADLEALVSRVIPGASREGATEARASTLVVYVDVDDTLVRSVGTKRIPIGAAITQVRALHGEGATLYCWSSGGAAYARASARELGIEGCFVGFLPKPEVMIDDQHPSEWRRLVYAHPAQVGSDSVGDYVARRDG